MKLIAICAGKVQKLEIDGQCVPTAYLKTPITGSVAVNRDGVAGNETAVHTDAIYAIAPEHYGYWQKKLGVTTPWEPGYFAENLLIEGLDEAMLSVGDTLAIGNSVRLTVAGPRIPCFKLCWRLKQPTSFIGEFALSGKMGVYFSVETPGSIQAGDTITLQHITQSRVPINDIAHYLFAKKAVHRETIQQLLSAPGLSQTSALMLKSKLSQTTELERVQAYRWSGWRRFTVNKIVRESDTLASVYLAAEDGLPLAPFRAGQSVRFRPLSVDLQRAELRGNFLDFDEQSEEYRISLNLQAVTSEDRHSTLTTVGDTVELTAPEGEFTIDSGAIKPILLIGYSDEVAPLLSMLKYLLHFGQRRPPLYFIHCYNQQSTQPFRKELDNIAEQFLVPMLHIPEHQTSKINTQPSDIGNSSLSLSDIKVLMSGCHIELGGKRIEMPLKETSVYISGSQPCTEVLYQQLVDAGVSEIHRIMLDDEVSAEVSKQLDSASVYFANSQIKAKWRAAQNLSLLELAETVGIQPKNSCRVGMCHCCQVPISQGRVTYDSKLPKEPKKGQVLICRARPATNKITLEL